MGVYILTLKKEACLITHIPFHTPMTITQEESK